MNEPIFVETAIGSPAHRGTIAAIKNLNNIYRENFGKEVYISTYAFDQDLAAHFNLQKTIKNFAGLFYCADTKYDIDAENSNLDVALANARKLVLQLINGFDVPEEWIQMWFSGSKGFHIVTPNLFGIEPSNTAHEDMKETVRNFCPDADLSIYAYSGLFRAPWSFHSGSSHFKVPFTFKEFMEVSIDDIWEVSKDPVRTRYDFEHPTWEDVEPLLKSERRQAPTRSVIAVSKKGMNADMTGHVGCMQELWNRGPVEGRRHQDVLRLVSSWRRRGLTLDQSTALTQEWISHTPGVDVKMTRYEISKIARDVYVRGYNYGCNDSVMREFCVQQACMFYKGKNFVEKVAMMGDAIEQMIWNMTQRREGGFDLQQVYGNGVMYSFRPGEVAVVYGDTKLGKTALLQNWAVSLNQQGYKILDLSLEMEQTLLVERYCQIRHGLTVNDQKGINEVSSVTRTGRLSPEDLAHGLSNIMIMTAAPSLESIDKLIGDHKPDIVTIDPLEDIHPEKGGWDSVKDQGDVIKGLKDIAARHRIIMLVVHHISKASASKPNQKLGKHSGKGSSSIAQKADHLLAFEGSPFTP